MGEDLDADEYGIRSDHQWKLSELLSATLKADYYQDSTLSTELTDVGRQNDVADRDTLTLQPGIIYQLDAKNAVNMGFAYTDVTTDPKANLIDYTYSQASLGGTHSLSETMQVFLSGFVSWFDVPSVQSSTATYGLRTGVTWQWNEFTEIEGSIGYLSSDIDFIDQFFAIVADPAPRIVLVKEARKASTSSPIAGFSISRSFEYLKTSFQYSRQVSPTVRGQQSLEDSMSAGVDYQFSRELTAGISGQYNIRASQSEQVKFAEGSLNADQLVPVDTLLTDALNTRRYARNTDIPIKNSPPALPVHLPVAFSLPLIMPATRFLSVFGSPLNIMCVDRASELRN